MAARDQAADDVTGARLGRAAGGEGVGDDRADVFACAQHEPSAGAGLDQQLD